MSLPADPSATLLWLAATLGVVTAVVGIWTVLRRTRRRHRAPVQDWQARFEAAERRAQQAEQLVKAGLLPHLAQWLHTKLVVALLRQRRKLLARQLAGTEQAQALERRLATVQDEMRRKAEAHPPSPVSGGGLGATGSTGADASPNPRRNPLLQRRPLATEPVRFHELLARRRQAPQPRGSGAGPVAEGQEDAPNHRTPN